MARSSSEDFDQWAFAIDRSSPRSPWQNGYAERLIGSIRRECLDHVVVFGERHLRHVLLSYMKYYNEMRTHLSLEKDAPSWSGPDTFFADRSSADCITSMSGHAYNDDYYDDGGCYVVRRRVHTRYRWRVRPVQICG